MNDLSAKQVSAVVCCWNAADTITECLASLKASGVGELILVDADSEDDTRNLARPYVDKILSDPREGLARARNIGIAEASCEYVLNVGADNVMPPGSIEEMLRCLRQGQYSGVSAMTYLKNSNMNYLSWAMNAYKRARFYPGERDVIGTPTLFKTQLLKDNPYDNRMSWSDDGDLCDRLARQGHRFAIADMFVYEIGSESFKSTVYRWRGYGKSDWEVYIKNGPNWNFARKVRSLTHPLRNELLLPFVRIPGFARLAASPFLLLITAIRYYSWMKFTWLGAPCKDESKG